MRPSVPEDFALLNEALHALKGFALRAEFFEGPTFEVEQVLFAHVGALAQVATAHHVAELFADQGVVL